MSASHLGCLYFGPCVAWRCAPLDPTHACSLPQVERAASRRDKETGKILPRGELIRIKMELDKEKKKYPNPKSIAGPPNPTRFPPPGLCARSSQTAAGFQPRVKAAMAAITMYISHSGKAVPASSLRVMPPARHVAARAALAAWHPVSSASRSEPPSRLPLQRSWLRTARTSTTPMKMASPL